MKIILASASPRRRELLQQLGIECFILPAEGEEEVTSSDPKEVVMELARKKAGEVYERMVEDKIGEQNSMVIGADTVVVGGGKILGKPKDREDACAMLESLSGRTHEVYTGVSLWIREDGEKVQYTFYEKTAVTMHPLSKEEIRAYVESGESDDKAGSYAIQGRGAVFIKKIDGDYNNVVGLPLARLYQELKQLGIPMV